MSKSSIKPLDLGEKTHYLSTKDKLVVILNKLHPGAVYPVTWYQDRFIPELGGEFRVIRTVTRVRLNCSYTNRKDVSKSTGCGSALPWGKWVKGQENKIIEYKDRYYLRLNFKSGLKGEDRIVQKYQQKIHGEWVDVDFAKLSEKDSNTIKKCLGSSPDKVANLMIIKIIKISKYML